MRPLLIALVGTGLLYSALLWAAPFVYEDASWLQTIHARQRSYWTLPGRELTTQTYRLSDRPDVQHGINIAIHLANGALVAVVGTALLSPEIGVAAAVVLLAHPLSSEAVAYVTARTDLLMTFWMLLAIWLLLQAIDRGGVWRLLGGLLATLAAGMSKELGIVAPLVMGWTVLLWRPDAPRAGFVRAVMIGMAGLCLGLTVGSAQRADLSFMGVQLALACRLLALSVVPRGLSFDHDALALMPFVGVAVGLTAFAAFIGLLEWASRRPLIPWLLGMLVILVGPRLVVASPEYLNEHWMYSAMPAISLALGALLLALHPVVILHPGRTYWRRGAAFTEA